MLRFSRLAVVLVLSVLLAACARKAQAPIAPELPTPQVLQGVLKAALTAAAEGKWEVADQYLAPSVPREGTKAKWEQVLNMFGKTPEQVRDTYVIRVAMEKGVAEARFTTHFYGEGSSAFLTEIDGHWYITQIGPIRFLEH
jgi:hypothetical protein